MTRCTLALLWVAAIAAGASAEVSGAPVVEVIVSPPETPYHRAGWYIVQVEGTATMEYTFPELASDPKQIETLGLGSERDGIGEGLVRHTKRYRLDAVFPGLYVVPPVQVSWRDGENEGVLTVPSVAFHARALTEPEQEGLMHFAGITSPGSLLPPPRFSWPTVLVVVALLVAGLIGVIMVVRYYRRADEQLVEATPSWQTALRRLSELQRRDLPGQGKIDPYYVDLSSILRYYIEDRFHIHAPEQTTPEFLETAAQRRLFSDEQQQFLAAFLRQCDQVKFARLQPGLDDMAGHFSQVKRFVQGTIPETNASDTLEEAA